LVENAQEFSQTLERLKTAQENDLFKAETNEDSQVNAMAIPLFFNEKSQYI
jgi:hypothetical protein